MTNNYYQKTKKSFKRKSEKSNKIFLKQKRQKARINREQYIDISEEEKKRTVNWS